MIRRSSSSKPKKVQLDLFHEPYIYLEEGVLPPPPATPLRDRRSELMKRFQDPYVYYDIYLEIEDAQCAASGQRVTRILGKNQIAQPEKLPNDSVLSKNELEKLVKEVFKNYKPHVTDDDWSRVQEYLTEFVEVASRTPEKMSEVLRKLRGFELSLMPDEKIEHFRAPSERIIRELKRLLN